RIGAARARAPQLAAHPVVRDDQGVLVEHRALEARVGTHVLADLFAQEARIAVGRERIQEYPERRPAPQGQADDLRPERADRHEIADEGETGIDRQRHPEYLLGPLAQNLLARPGALVELHPVYARALGPLLDPHEQFGPYRLWTGVAAPQPS